ncbi:winged helix-turn-helix transcriptional regulator [Paenibacillus methanolicus]|uniref:DNA-binding HxlR family transcriptional regulator n=1 Tax=Paenibacillus methanolicus TaxID=582686 RepID=A0A5S5CAM6_9BACL|nr:helix-turn-helix domain-containing protein [Paenibacillus methanolicus]TYP75390.1 DNA-binding HxlR family transcriptional regulator [Paenibacillus methanolicus]
MMDRSCPGTVEPILEILDGKWMLLLLFELFNGNRRFGELRRKLHPISPKTLTDRLRLLEEKGIVTRTIFPGVPLHVEYDLTEAGQGLQPIFAAMWAWTQAHGGHLRGETNDAGSGSQQAT